MKKICVAFVLILLTVTASYAQIGVGARSIAMGGAFVAIANDVTAAYYNPAGAAKIGAISGKLSLGGSANNLDQMTAAIGNPSKFLQDNFNKNVSFNGNLDGIVGFASNKFGLAAVVQGALDMTKPAGSVSPSGNGTVTEDITLTLAHSFDVPGLSVPYFSLGSIDVGINAKYIIGQMYSEAPTGVTNFSETIANASGTAFDIGAAANLTSMVKAGIVFRNIVGSENWSGTTTTKKIDPLTGQVSIVTAGTPFSQDNARTPVTAIGAALDVPGTGLLTALEIDSAAGSSVTRLGVEYPLIPMLLKIRGGYVTGTGTAMWTSGLGITFPIFELNIAYGSNTNTNSNFAVIDLISMGI